MELAAGLAAVRSTASRSVFVNLSIPWSNAAETAGAPTLASPVTTGRVGSDTSSVSGSITLAQQTQPVSFTGGNPQPQGSAPMPSIEFFPDGSCDAAQITVASRDSDDTRRAAVRLVGSNGEMKRQPMPGEEADSAKVSDLAQANPGSQ